MRISTSLLYQRGVNSINDQQSTLSSTQTQLSTGERLQAPSDDPFAATRIVALDEKEKALDQYQRNANVATLRLEQEEVALTGVVNTLQRLSELAIQGANESLTAPDREALSFEAFQLVESLLQLSNTVDASGEYIFSGDKTDTVTYEEGPQGTFSYKGDHGQRLLQIGSSREVAVGDSGYSVFENIPVTAGGTKNIMEIAYDFADALATDNSANISDSIGDIRASLLQISTKRSVIGGRINAIESEVNANESFSLLIVKNRSDLADLDYAEAISRFQQELAGLQAAQQSFVQIQNLSLFNYL